MSKSLFKSKTFWFQVLTVVVSVTDILPAKYAIPVAAVGNVLLRLVTDRPIALPAL